ncbi:hypothetical protein ABW20_dc0108931 [Dactylellina cionopaga]|nr:hypothetical protein ABW20_dc0108931 [Dactylellina cionopaga]
MPSLKRKRDSETTASAPPSTSRSAIDDIFRRHFESKFGAVELTPVASQLKESKKSSRKNRDDDDSPLSLDDDLSASSQAEDTDSDIIGDEDEVSGREASTSTARPEPEVVTYDFSRRGPPPTSKPSRQSFMTSKPPSSIHSSAINSAKPKNKDDKADPAEEAINLKNDLALHRLLRESHLLDKETLTHSSGANRLKAIESRIQSLGGTPLQKLTGAEARIPLHIKKGMARKQAMREDKRKKVARENGIVVAKETKSKKSRERKRDAGVGNPSVGKFRKGALVLSRRDVMGMKG